MLDIHAQLEYLPDSNAKHDSKVQFNLLEWTVQTHDRISTSHVLALSSNQPHLMNVILINYLHSGSHLLDYIKYPQTDPNITTPNSN